MAKKTEKQEIVKELPIVVEGYEDFPILYTNYLFVTHLKDEFLLTFAQIHPPYMIHPTEQEVKDLKYMPASVISRLALTPSKMKELIDTLKENYNKYTKKKEGK